MANTGEIAAGIAARDKAPNAEVKGFAERMIKEHTDLQAQGRALAQRPEMVAGNSADYARQVVAKNSAEPGPLSGGSAPA